MGKRKFVGYMSLGQLMNVTGVEGAVRNTPGTVLCSTESQEQGAKRGFYFVSRIHPEMLFGCCLQVRPSLFGFQM